ncbi:Osmolarity two-component system protein [Dirofilaria immitis]
MVLYRRHIYQVSALSTFDGSLCAYHGCNGISLEYLLLPPRSAPMEAPTGPTPKVFNANHCDPLTRCGQVSCYTFLSGFQLPWPPSCCLYQPTPFMGSHERKVWHFNSTFGSSHSASSAYQKWPTWSTHSMSMLHSFI